MRQVFAVHFEKSFEVHEQLLSQFRGMSVVSKVSDYLPLIGNVLFSAADVSLGHFKLCFGSDHPANVRLMLAL